MIGVVFASMFLLAAAIVVLPLYRGAAKTTRGGEALTVYRQQLNELERDLSLGLLNEKEAETARLEIHRRMLGASGEADAGGASLSQRIVTGVAVVILLGATALYVMRGEPGLVSPLIDRGASAAQQFQLPPEMGKIEDRLAQLEAKLVEEPENLEGWSMLARSYNVLGRKSDAANAYAQAAILDPDNTELRLVLAETLVEALDGLVSPAAKLVFERVREMDPSHAAPSFYLGLAEYQNNRTREALEIWLALEADSPADAPWLPALRGQIDRVQTELGIGE